MADYDFETEHLGLDWRDRVLLKGPGAMLGFIDRDPEWPAGLGPEPRWFLTEVAELRDKWDDAWRFLVGCRAQAEGDWLAGKGAIRG